MNKILFSIFAVLLTLVLLCSACSKTDSASSVPISEHSNEVPEVTDAPIVTETVFYDQSDYIDENNNEYGVVNTDGVISFTWFGTEKPEDLSFFIYDENDALIKTYTKSETSADGYMTTLFVIRAGVNPTRIEITGTELETANTIMSDIVLNIDMTHGTGDESDHYSILLDSLADCYERSYTGVWYYNIPVHWYELYLAEAQAD